MGRDHTIVLPVSVKVGNPKDPNVIGVCRRCKRQGLISGTRICTGSRQIDPKVTGWETKLHRPHDLIVSEPRSKRCIDISRRAHARLALRVRVRLALEKVTGKR